MKKALFTLFLCVFALGFSQKKKNTKSKAVVEKETAIIYTEADAESTKEPRIIAGFLKQNPESPRKEFFKKKLIDIIMANNSSEIKPTINKTINNKDKVAKTGGITVLNGSKTIASSTATPNKYANTPKPTTITTPKNEVGFDSASKKNEKSEKSKKTAAMLSHMFNYDPSDKDAYINIKNRSKCNLIVKISGKKDYNLEVPAKSQNFVMIDKGDYVLSTMVCDAKYVSAKKISKDIEIELNVQED